MACGCLSAGDLSWEQSCTALDGRRPAVTTRGSLLTCRTPSRREPSVENLSAEGKQRPCAPSRARCGRMAGSLMAHGLRTMDWPCPGVRASHPLPKRPGGDPGQPEARGHCGVLCLQNEHCCAHARLLGYPACSMLAAYHGAIWWLPASCFFCAQASPSPGAAPGHGAGTHRQPLLPRSDHAPGSDDSGPHHSGT